MRIFCTWHCVRHQVVGEQVDSNRLAPWEPLSHPCRPGSQPVHPSTGQPGLLGQGEMSRAGPEGWWGQVDKESRDRQGPSGR